MRAVLLVLVLVLVACGDNTHPIADARTVPDAPPPDAGIAFHQIEQLARPGVSEVLLLGDGFFEAYNTTAPSFTGIPTSTLKLAVGEAKTVLKSLYLGACLINGQLGLSAVNGVRPAGARCEEVGAAIFEPDGETLKASVAFAAQAYADRVFAQFEPDVMRIDVGDVGTRPVSAYESLCDDAMTPTMLLCGGRHLRDDVVDITYDYFLNGAATCTTGIRGLCPGGVCAGTTGLCGAPNQVNALVSDGVVFDPANNNANVGSRQNGTTSNTQQGHPNVAAGFPYAAPPF